MAQVFILRHDLIFTKWSSRIPHDASMGLVYLPTNFTIKINHSCRETYQSHGCYGYEMVLLLCLFVVDENPLAICVSRFIGFC